MSVQYIKMTVNNQIFLLELKGCIYRFKFKSGDMILCESIRRKYSTQLLVIYNMDEDYMCMLF